MMQEPPLSRSSLIRDHALRSRSDVVPWALEQSDTTAVLVDGDRSLVAHNALVRVAPQAIPAGARVAFLGRSPSTGSIVVAAFVDDIDDGADAEGIDVQGTWMGLREIGATLSDEDAGILTQAVALGRWQESHGFSPSDGSAVQWESGGWSARDGQGREHFPRTDPAVIALVTDESGDRILLGRNAAWTERFSLFAGFVDPGESLEAAVVREVQEEAGVRVRDVQYVASQPWPFPRSLMVGFTCVAEEPERAEADGDEIAEIRWLTRDEVRNGAVALPSGASIAAFLVQRWLHA